ncbi:hypothetical protein H0A36_23610 [Endozoicomonas sp. SM1973]|uniref:Uncharacterized protein n=1 Tax=Spartinivicinus marinus TaxID=2994442 RepID=A0A853IB04_9GAMM|nr:hypothetical protein [Spartinivicinus marinus]MCX4026036.1 hypothetical protein [Spartinivicinus marinus]NYZ69012.1 hypothetical protein [Spartinivicinus marinus]
MKKLIVLLFAATVIASSAQAGEHNCTPEEMQQKGMEAATAMQSLAATNPAKMQEIMQALQDLQVQAANTKGSYSALCKKYDELLEKVKG